MTALLEVHERRLTRGRRLSAASSRALELADRAKKRLTALQAFGGRSRYPDMAEALMRAWAARTALSRRLYDAAVLTLTGGER